MKLDLNQFDLPALMGALGAAEGSMGEMIDDPALPKRFQDCASAWLAELQHLSKAIAETHNAVVRA